MKSQAGMVTWFAGDSANIPDGWLVCDGSNIIRGQFEKLFEAIGTTWGGDGTTHFKLPDFLSEEGKGCTIRAATDDVSVGTKQRDATRQLAGFAHTLQMQGDTSIVGAGGCFKVDNVTNGWISGQGQFQGAFAHLKFDNNGVPNYPVSDEFRMASVSMIPVICTGEVEVEFEYITIEDLEEKLAAYWTASEVNAEIQEAVAPLATNDALQGAVLEANRQFEVIENRLSEVDTFVEGTTNELERIDAKVDATQAYAESVFAQLAELAERVAELENAKKVIQKLTVSQIEQLTQEEKEEIIIIGLKNGE